MLQTTLNIHIVIYLRFKVHGYLDFSGSYSYGILGNTDSLDRVRPYASISLHLRG